MTMKQDLVWFIGAGHGKGFFRRPFLITSGLAVVMTALLGHAAGEMTFPDPLKFADGKAVTTPQEWQQVRRPEILELFRTNVYGRAPVGRPDNLRFEVTEISTNALDGAATRKLVDIHFAGPGGTGTIHLAVIIPNKRAKPAPGFLLICTRGRENIDASRKVKRPYWPVEQLVERGYAAAAFHVSDIDPDQHDGFTNGVHGIYDRKDIARPADAWGSIAAWSWGASRAMDYFATDPDIDTTRMAVVGHSRCGKAALWCGAQDERFKLVISNDSGSTGAALARGKRGEDIKSINHNFPHWFCANYKRYDGKEADLPIDQHELLALMAPRLVYVASAQGDAHADPQSEFLSCVRADPVYRLLGVPGMNSQSMPNIETPVHDGHIGYHIRSGKHNLTEYDWMRFMDFADKHWNQASGTKSQPTVDGDKKSALQR